jgi:heptose I phosphotransferase
MRVNHSFSRTLAEHGLTSFDAVARFDGRTVVRKVSGHVTARFTLATAGGPASFFIKTHGFPPLKEFVKPLSQFRRPVVGARHEWDAMIRLYELGIPSMTPVALGQRGFSSFVISQAVENCENLAERLQRAAAHDPAFVRMKRRVIDAVARIAGRMHRQGIHHQDLYLCHFLVPLGSEGWEVRVIDLGRAQMRRRLARRWIIKDLGQLCFSARQLTRTDHLRFMRAYLGRRLESQDVALLRKIARKASAIAKHSQKHAL